MEPRNEPELLRTGTGTGTSYGTLYGTSYGTYNMNFEFFTLL